MSFYLAYVLLGLFIGFFAGLLGIGGGIMMIPILVMLFKMQLFPGTDILHLALGTSMATIIFTATASIRAHHRHKAVLWPVVWQITPGILLGTLLGAKIAASIPTKPLSIFFACFVILIALQMLLGFKPKPTRGLPGYTGFFFAGSGIGIISALVAIGGGSLVVPFLLWCNVQIKNAIGTSAGIGLPIAIGGTLGYIYNGWNQPGLPDHTLGFVYLPAMLCLVIGSMTTAPLGARVSHRMPVNLLRRIFACLLILLAGKLVYDLFS